jgi:hypothetical protein
LTSLDTAAALLEAAAAAPGEMEVRTIEEWRQGTSPSHGEGGAQRRVGRS